METFIGREEQLARLSGLWQKKTPSLVTCRGRRRIGKSTLVEEFARRTAKRLLRFAGLPPAPGQTNTDQLREFAGQLAAQTGGPKTAFADWSDAFRALDAAIRDGERTIILLDEISWMGGKDANFPGKLKNAWDILFKRHAKLIVVLCGSVSAWIAENILSGTGFVGRDSLDLVLRELPPSDCVKLWGARAGRLSVREKLDLLSVTGGVPKYLEEIRPEFSAEANIRDLFFTPEGILFRDFRQVFGDLFGRRADDRQSILEALANGAKSLSEIADALKQERNGHLGDWLSELEQAGFVARDSGLNPQTGLPARAETYRLSDNYTRFFLRFVLPHTHAIERGLFRFSSLEQLPGWESVLGLQFENLVLNNAARLAPLVGFDGALVLSAAPWRKVARGKAGNGVQIDLLYQTQRSVCVVEIKRRREIGPGIANEVAQKVERLALRHGTSVRTALVYDGELSPTVQAEGWFDYLIPASRLFEI
ncbi:MAG: ATPase [Kiritimatiellae bacterium]|nr:ATPase [Kiritimatiellia bacterium]